MGCFKKPRTSSQTSRDEEFGYPPRAAAVSADRVLPGLAGELKSAALNRVSSIPSFQSHQGYRLRVGLKT